jgi:hypothetical protein
MALTNLSQITTSGISTLADINLNNLTGVAATFTGNVTIGGTLTYDDVTNIDSVGLITARSGIRVLTGTATTALVVEGNSRITGILTVGTSSLTLNGSTNVVKVGTALTLGHTQGLQFHTQNLHSQGFEINNVNATGIITATTFIGNLTGTASNASGATGDFSIADKIVHTGNTNTAIRFPAADTVTVETGGAENARFTSGSITFKAPDGGNRYLFGEMGNSANAELSLYNSSDAQKVRISAGQATFFTGGNVGIGTNAPLSALHVKGPAGEVSARFTDAVNATVFVSHPSSGKSKIADAGGNYGFEFDTASVNIISGGSEKFRINSSGKVGIGTAAPQRILHAYESTSNNLLFLESGDLNVDIVQADTAGSTRLRSTSGAFKFYTNGASSSSSAVDSVEKFSITSAGAILAGESSASQGRFSFHNAGSSGGNSASTNNMGLSVRNDAGPSIVDLTGTDNFTARLHNGAYAGTGVSNPQGTITKLLFHGATHNGWNAHAAMCMDVQGTSGGRGDLVFLTGGNGSDLNQRLRIASDGKIAIGGNYGDTSAFGRQVLISGTLGLNNDSGNVGMGFHRGTSNTYGYIGTGAWAVTGLNDDDFGISSGATGDLAFATGASGYSVKMKITNAGNVGINDTAPSEKLNVGGNIMLEGGDQFMYLTNVGTGNAGIYVRGNTSGSFLRSHSTGIFTWEVTGSEKMRLKSNGHLGIGNADPTQARLVAQTASGMSIAAIKDNTGASISLGGVTQPRVLLEAGASASEFKLYTASGSSYSSAGWNQRLTMGSTGQLTVSNTVSSNDAAVNILKSSGDNSDKAILRIGYDAAACFEAYRIRNDANIYMGATQAGADINISTKPSGTSSSAVALTINDGGVTNPRRFATGAMHVSMAYRPHQLGYMGDYFPYGCNAVFYLAQTSTGNAGYSSHMFSWYDSGHWGQYGKFVLFCQEAAYIGGFAQRYLQGTTVNTILSGGQGGSVSTTQTQTGSGTHAGQNVYRYDCTVSHSGTYRTMRWYLGVLAGCSLGVTGSGKTQAEANTYCNSNGGMLHLFGVSDSNLTMAPNYRTW